MKRVTDYFAAAPAKRSALATPPASQDTKVTLQTSTQITTQPAQANASEHILPLKPTEPVSVKIAPPVKTTTPVGWDKEAWVASLDEETRELLRLEINTLDPSWLKVLKSEITKPYFLDLKRYLQKCRELKGGPAIFPPEQDIYSWSRLTPLPKVKVLILGQDPYHNVGQAHGLAFSVRPPTPPPPSLLNIYKELRSCYPETFEVPKHGSLVKWAHQGVLMLNACLTVEAHKANSHANKGWEQFTEEVVRVALKHNPHIVLLAWGRPASMRVDKVKPGKQHLVLRSVHPSPLSASRGWFGSAHFTKANEWLTQQGEKPIDWHLLSIRKNSA